MTEQSAPRLVADIGGTNARFALVGEDSQPSQERVLRCADYSNIAEAVEAYLANIDARRPRHAVFAIATPITGDLLTMTNHGWSFSIEQTRRTLQLQQLQVINDFSALAAWLPWLDATDLRQVGGGAAIPGMPIGVLGPGTGLGVSGLIYADGRWLPLQSEGGHASVSPANAKESAIIASCARQFGHVSIERLVSGMGLRNLHAAISELESSSAKALSPEMITQHALNGTDELCEQVVETFCALLGAAAGNLALTLGATGGIYIGGGIVPKLGRYFHRTPFRKRFEAKGRAAVYLADIPTFVIHAANPALIGAARTQ